MKTSCKDCCFATYPEDSVTQDDCKLGKLSEYRKNNVPIEDVYDNDREFYLIDGQCNFKRKEKWADYLLQHNRNLHEQIKIETNIKTSLFIYIGDETKDLNQINMTVNCIDNKHQPHNIVVILNTDKFTSQEVRGILKDSKLPNWYIETVFDREPPNEEIDKEPPNSKRVSLSRCVQLISNRYKRSTFWCVIKCGHLFPAKLFQEIEFSINSLCKSFVFVKGSSESFYVIYSKLALLLPCVDIVKEVEEISVKNNEPRMLMNYEQLV